MANLSRRMRSPYLSLNFALVLAWVTLSVLANPIPSLISSPSYPIFAPKSTSSSLITVSTIHQFPKETWIENLAIRSNGQILATVLSAPELYQIDPESITPPILVHTFPSTTGLLGITEVEQDVFYVIAGRFSLKTFERTPGSDAVWKVDVGHLSAQNVPAAVEKVADFPESGLLNGVVLLSRDDGLVLIADSILGVVWCLNVNSGASKIVIDDPLMKPTTVPAIGINGIKIRDGILYFTNSNAATLNRVPINQDGTPAGPAQIVSSNIPGDDFQLDGHGNAFVTEMNNELGFVVAQGSRGPAGNQTVLLGSPNSLVLAGPTAVQFGRRSSDMASLYVTTNGGDAAWLTGNVTIGGAVLRVDVGAAGF